LPHTNPICQVLYFIFILSLSASCSFLEAAEQRSFLFGTVRIESSAVKFRTPTTSRSCSRYHAIRDIARCLSTSGKFGGVHCFLNLVIEHYSMMFLLNNVVHVSNHMITLSQSCVTRSQSSVHTHFHMYVSDHADCVVIVVPKSGSVRFFDHFG